MVEDNFLDTNIIINYVNFDKVFYKKVTKICYDYLTHSSGKIILCFAVVEELYKIMKDRSRIYHVVLQMIEKSEESLCETLPKKDIPLAKKMYVQFKGQKLEVLNRLLLEERRIFETKIDLFLKMNVHEKVIPLNQIDRELTNKIHDINSNHADCKILASALQLQKTRDKFLFVTVDGTDFDPNSYDYLKKHFETNYSSEGHKFPTLLNLLFVS